MGVGTSMQKISSSYGTVSSSNSWQPEVMLPDVSLRYSVWIHQVVEYIKLWDENSERDEVGIILRVYSTEYLRKSNIE